MAKETNLASKRFGKNSSNITLVLAFLVFLASSLLAFLQTPGDTEGPQNFPEWFISPIESNALARRPKAFPVAAVSHQEDGSAIAVGIGGLIITSDDSGITWNRQTSPTQARLNAVAKNSAGAAIAVGANGAIFVSGDDGASWEQSGYSGDSDLEDVDLLANGRAIAVGSTVLYSADSGASWTEASGDWDNIRSVSLLADGRAIAVGDAGTIFTSDNSGVDWVERTVVSEANFSSVSLQSNGRSIAVAESGVIYTSIDFGRNWTFRGVDPNLDISVVALLDDGRALASADDGTLLISTNNGETWSIREADRQFGFDSISFLSNGSVFAASDVGAIVASDDAGVTWQERTVSLSSWINDLALSDDGLVIGLYGGDSFITSNDAGETWSQSFSHNGSPLNAVAIEPSSDSEQRSFANAIAVGEADILISSDSGANWLASGRELQFALNSVAISARGSAIAVGDAGTILLSNDAGETWTDRNLENGGNLRAVAISADGIRAIAGGRAGTILTSEDGGQNWSSQPLDTQRDIELVSMASNGVAIAIAGEEALIGRQDVFYSSDFGSTWEKRTASRTPSVNDVTIESNGAVITVGFWTDLAKSADGGQSWVNPEYGPTLISLFPSVASSSTGRAVIGVSVNEIVVSDDFGSTWRSVDQPLEYARYPAPWYWLAIGLALILLRIGMTAKIQNEDDGAAAIAASDAPTVSGSQDRLNFLPLARGISRFLRNTNTTPPLTLAITGDWGSGKSSLMHLISEDMRRYDWRPIWFNAWHHQNEEQLLPALLGALRAKGLPPVFSTSGIAYRLRLLWARSRKHYFITLLAVSITAFLTVFVISNLGDVGWQGIADFATSLASDEPNWSALFAGWTLPALILQILAAVPVIIALRRALTAFGLDPAVLLSASFEKTKLRDLSSQTSFRTKFATEFDEVTKALAFPPVIVIDDLDRCQAKTVLDIMEAVNFLTSSGSCFIIFGMARERVQASLAMSFSDIARELVELDAPETEESNEKNKERQEREKRQRYATDYLEKLINIEVSVPLRTDIPPHHLLEQRDEQSEPSLLKRTVLSLKPIALITPILLTMALAGYWASTLSVPQVEKPALPPLVAEVTEVQSAQPPNVPEGEVIDEGLPDQPELEAQFDEGARNPIAGIWFLLAFIGLLGALAFLRIQQVANRETVVRDTKAFSDALRVWSPIASFSRSSPRSIKRFGNRIRYLAMLQQGEQIDDKPGMVKVIEVARDWLNGLLPGLGRNDSVPAESPEDKEKVLSEHRVVALGALYEQCGDEWTRYASNEWTRSFDDEGNDFEEALDLAIDQYEEETRAAWPPSEEEREAFARSLRGVRVQGETVPIRVRMFPKETFESAKFASDMVSGEAEFGTAKSSKDEE